MRFLVRIYHYGNGYSAMVPDLPGCVAAAETVEEVRELIAEAIRLHLDLMRKSGENIPEPTRHFDFDDEDIEEDELITWVKLRRRKVAHR